MKSKPSRRWLRFSLRGLMVLVTILCCWLGWEVRIVNARKKLRNEAEALGFQFQTGAAFALFSANAGKPGGSKPARIFFLRSLLGDNAIQTIHYSGWGTDNAQLDKLPELTTAFPEASLIADPFWADPPKRLPASIPENLQ